MPQYPASHERAGFVRNPTDDPKGHEYFDK